jgi:hypothetical protein
MHQETLKLSSEGGAVLGAMSLLPSYSLRCTECVDSLSLAASLCARFLDVSVKVWMTGRRWIAR